MANRILLYMQNYWPFSAFKFDDLVESDRLVNKLAIPKHTKEFVYAVRVPESKAVIYILCVQNLSERSALDAEYLIREIRPDVVVAQIGDSVINEIQSEENQFRNGSNCGPVPTSSFEVLKQCFVHKTNRDKYENVAGSLVLREIFGVGFHGHFLAAKNVAKEIGSSFLFLESPFVEYDEGNSSSGETDSGNKFQALGLQPSGLVPQQVGSVIPLSLRTFCITNDLRSQLGKSLSSHLMHSTSEPKVGSGDIQPSADYNAPQFAKSVYPLLVDLHNIFLDIPTIGKGLAHAQKMLSDVNRGDTVDTHLLSEVYIFRIAVEGLRIALNNAGRLPLNKLVDTNSTKTEFCDLPVDDKSHALLAHALRSQTINYKSIVAIVDAGGLAGLRKHWNTPVPPEVKDMVEELVIDCTSNGETLNHKDRKRLLTNKPVVAVGAGATAVLGASSLSKVVPASTFMKLITFKVPASLKIMMTQTQKAFAIALGKTIGPSKVVAPGFASSGVKTTSALKAAASAEKFRAVAHSVITSAEKTSLSAMRTALYEIMRKRRVQRIGFLPWATFGCSVATCTGLLVYGDGIECAVELLPAAPSIASLGRGIRSLHLASDAVRDKESSRIQKSIESLLYSLKKMKAQ